MFDNMKFPLTLKLVDAEGFLEHCKKHSQKSYELGKTIAEQGEITLYGVYRSIHGTPVMDTRIKSGVDSTIGLMVDEMKFFEEVKVLDIFEVASQLKAAGYSSEDISRYQIIITNLPKLSASELLTRDVWCYTDILIVDNVIYRDRTGCLKGIVHTFDDIMSKLKGSKNED